MPACAPELASVAPAAAWYVGGRSRDIGHRPHRAMLLGMPLVLFRDRAGRPCAWLDRCPHRSMPLSAGNVTDRGLQCRYHGWTFAHDGSCVDVPCRADDDAHVPYGAVAFPVVEQDGYLWVCPRAGHPPADPPHRFGDDPEMTTVAASTTLDAPLQAVLENILDVPHTAFLHRGLFRGRGPSTVISTTLVRHPDGVEMRYNGEPRPGGVAGWLLAPGGGVVVHSDRFILPSITVVDYALGDHYRLRVTSALTPLEGTQTRLYARLQVRTRLPGAITAALITPVAWWVMGQDRRALRLQTENVEKFGGDPPQRSTDLDRMGLAVARCLRDARLGELPVESRIEHEGQIRI